MKDVISILMENEISTYIQSENEQKIIHKIIWDENNNCDVLGEVLMHASDFNGILSCVKNDDCINIKDKINFLKKTSIYNNNCILKWIKKYSNKFPKYWHHMKSVENLRIVGLLYLEKNVISSHRVSRKHNN